MYVMKPPAKTLVQPAPQVKSAMRVMEILEFFSRQRSGATVTEIGNALGYPQSSTSMLLGSLVAMGYLKLEEATRSYTPTLRVMLLGAWLQDDLFAGTSLASSMKELSLRTRAGVLVGLRQGIHVRFILSIPSGTTSSLKFAAGIVRPVCRSAAGKALLAHEREKEINRIAAAANSTLPPKERIDAASLIAEIRQCRKRGWAESRDYPQPGWSNIAMQLPAIEGQPLMAVTLGVRRDALETRRESLVEALRAAVANLRGR